ncbi:MAG: MFS transporter [Gemmatimonadota bacterium]|nr:MFS transporter [Gemmatimonadota bacterium]MDH5759297.1 MFS transporter [Gemmatimonadota bacterium]
MNQHRPTHGVAALGDNLGQILLLALTNAFVGGMVGIERTVLPLIAETDFGIASKASAIAFIATFGVTKALVNFLAGGLSDRWGRRRLLLLGWLVGIPVPLLLMYAPSWSWVLIANVLLGVNQSLTWSMTVVMKVDLASPRTFGLVIGWNEFAGYAGMSITAVATGIIASHHGLRPEPFYVGIAVALIGLFLSWFTRDTRSRKTTPEKPESVSGDGADGPSLVSVLRRGTFGHAALSSASLAGLATNLKDGALWGLLPIVLVARGVSIERIGVVVALYPAVWSVSQLYFGPLSDRVGRRGLIAAGLVLQGLGVGSFAMEGTYGWYLGAAMLAGLGTGMVYPTLLAFVSDLSDAEWRASALGVYRLWRDLGYAVGALGAGVLADTLGAPTAMSVVAGLSGAVALAFGARTRPRRS